MPTKDREKANEQARERMRKHRAVTPGVTPDNDVTPSNVYFRASVTLDMGAPVTPETLGILQEAMDSRKVLIRPEVAEALGLVPSDPQAIAGKVNTGLKLTPDNQVMVLGGSTGGAIYDTAKRYGGSI